MSQHMASAILANKIPKVRSEPHICHCRLVIAPTLYREAFEEDEPLSIEQLGADSGKEAG